jgi:hypothetical protein
MIDRMALEEEMQRARSARGEAEEAVSAVEELLWEIRYPRTWRRLAQIEAGEPEPLARKH